MSSHNANAKQEDPRRTRESLVHLIDCSCKYLARDGAFSDYGNKQCCVKVRIIFPKVILSQWDRYWAEWMRIWYMNKLGHSGGQRSWFCPSYLRGTVAGVTPLKTVFATTKVVRVLSFPFSGVHVSTPTSQAWCIENGVNVSRWNNQRSFERINHRLMLIIFWSRQITNVYSEKIHSEHYEWSSSSVFLHWRLLSRKIFVCSGRENEYLSCLKTCPMCIVSVYRFLAVLS